MATQPKPSPPLPMQKRSLILNLHPISIAIILFIMTPVILVILWICLTLHFPSFQVTSVTVTSLTTTPSAQLTASFQVNGTLANTNIIYSILFESLHLELWFDHHTLASTAVRPLPFSAGPQTDTPVEAQFPVSLELFPRGVVRGIAQQRVLGLVDFGVTLQGRVRFLWGALMHYSNYFTVRVLELECNSLYVAFSVRDNNATGRLVAPRYCSPVQ